MANHIHNIARGVCRRDDSVLLAWHKKQQYYFLPGGHVEVGESSAAALVREIMEELGLAVTCGDFLLLFEHAWKNGEELQHELTSVFDMELVDADAELESRVDHLEFRWVPVAEITTVKFLPGELRDPVVYAVTGKSVPHFISTMR